MAKGERVDSKTAVLAVLDILKKHSDEKHPLSIMKILEVMSSKKYELIANRDTVKDTLSKIQEYYGDDVIKCETTERNAKDDKKANTYKYRYYYNRNISDEDLQILINNVMFSKMMTKEKVKELTRKLKDCATEDFQKKLNYLDMIPDKQFTLNRLTLDNIAEIHKVIYENRNRRYDKERRIIFNFNGYGADKKLHKIRKEPYTVLPLRICEVNHRYYLICYSDGKDNLSHYRIDLMTNLREEQFCGLEKNEKKERLINNLSAKNVSDYMCEHLYMFYGDSKRIELEVQKDKGDASLTFLFDAFGTNWNVIKEDDNKVTVSVRCTVDAMKIWVMQYINKIKVVGPADVKLEIDKKIISSLEGYLSI